MRVLLSLLCLAAVPLLADAQAGPRSTFTPGAAQRASLVGFLGPLVVGTALVLPADASDGMVGAGAVLIFTGSILGPAVGFWGGGAAGRGWLGAGIRAGVVAISAASLLDPNDDDIGAASVAAVGLMGAIAHATFDVIRVKPIVRQRQARATLGLAPAWVDGGGVGARIAW